MPKLKFDAHDVAAAACEVRRKALGTWLSNVYDLGDKRTFLLKFARSGGRTESGEGEKIVLLLESGVRFHTTSYDKTSPSLAAETNSAHAQRKARQPSPFCAKLRMHLRGKRLAGLTQMGADRAIDLAFGAGPNAHHLILECFAQGNLVLTDAEYRILTLLRPVRDDDNGLAMLGNHPYPLERRRPFVAVTREKLRAALEGGGGGGAARGEGEEDEKGAAGVTTEEGDRGGEERREPAAARAAADVEGGRRTQTQKTQNPSKKPSSKTRPGGPPSSRGGDGGGSSRPPATLREALCRDLGLGPRVVDRVARSAGFGAKGGGESPKAALESPDAFEKVFKALAALDEWRESLETFSSEEGEEGEDVEQRTEEEGEGVGEQNASSSSGTPNPAGRRSRVVPGYLTVERGTLEAGDGSSKTDDSPDGGATGESSSPPPLVESASAPDYVDFSPFPPEPSEEATSSSQKRTIVVPFASGFDDALDAYFAAVESRAALRARDRASKNALKRAEKVKLDQARRVASLAKEVATAALHAELVERNVEAVDVALNAVNAALAGGQSWGDLERTIAEEKRAGNPVARSIREMRLAENRVSVALPRAGEEAEEETSGGDDESDASESGGGDDESAAAAPAAAAGGERDSDSDSDSDSDDSSRRRRGGKKNKGGKRNGSRRRLVAVSLDLSLSAHANARFHHDRRKALEAKLRKTERANAHGAVDAALARRGALDLADAERRGKVPTRVPDAGDVRRAPEWFEKFHWFVTPERCLVVSARDAAQADALVLKYMGPDDAYVHADVQGAPPTLVKAPPLTYVKASAAKSEASAAKSSSDEGASDDASEKLVSEKLVVSEKKRSAEEKLSDGLALPKVLEGWCGRVPPSSLAMAGAACLCRSSAWDQRAVMSAWWARPRDVAKATPEGDPLPSGVAWTTGPRTHLPPAPLVMGFAYAFTLADEASVRRHGGLGLGLGGIADIIAEGTGGEVVMREEGPEEGRRTTRAIERRAADDRGEGGGGGEGGEGGEGVGVEGPGEGDGVGSDRGGFRDDRPESSNDAAGEDAAEGMARATTTKLDAFLDADVLSGGLSGLSLGGGPTTPTLPPAHPAAGEDAGGGGEHGEGEGASSEQKPSAGASVEPSADPERSGRSGRISAKARRDLKKARRRRTETGATDERPEEDGPEEGPEDGPEDEDRSDEDRSSSSGRDDFGGRAKSNSKTGAHQTPPGPGPGPQGPGPQKKKKLSRGKAAKAKRAAARYADQDDEDRELAAALAAAAGEKKEKGLGKRGAKGKKGERGKNTAAAVWGEEDPAADREGGILAPPNEGGAEAVPNGPGEASSTASSRTTQQLARTRQREDQQRARAAAGSYSPAFVSDPAAFAAKNAERMSRVAVFAGAPGPGDAISHAVAIVAPWPALRGFRYKAKLTPGTQKKGKAAKQAAEICQKAPVDFKEMRAVPRVASETAAEDADSKATDVVADGEKGVSLHARDGERAFKALDKALRERMRLSALKNAGGDLAQIMCGNGVKVSMPAGAAKAINAEKRGKKKG